MAPPLSDEYLDPNSAQQQAKWHQLLMTLVTSDPLSSCKLAYIGNNEVYFGQPPGPFRAKISDEVDGKYCWTKPENSGIADPWGWNGTFGNYEGNTPMEGICQSPSFVIMILGLQAQGDDVFYNWRKSYKPVGRLSDPEYTNATQMCSCPSGQTLHPSMEYCSLPITCPAGKNPYPQYDNKCLTPIEVNLLSKKPKADLCVGNPIYPMTGTKKEVVNTGIFLGDEEIQFVYDTALRPSNQLWRSSFQKMLITTTSSGSGSFIAERGSGKSYGLLSSTSVSNDICGERAVTNDSVSSFGGVLHYKDANSGNLESYNATGHLSKTFTASGQQITTLLSDTSTPPSIAPAPGYIIRMTDANGRSVSFEYTLVDGQPAATGGVVSSVTDSGGNKISLAYNSTGNITKLTWPDGAFKTFLYEDINVPWALTGILDENNSRFSTWTYASTGQALTSEHAGGVGKTTISYSMGLPGVPTVREELRGDYLCRIKEITSIPSFEVITPNGSTSTATVNSELGYPQLAGLSQSAGSGCAPSNNSSTFDSKGNISSQNDFNGKRTCYAYDAKDNEILRVEGLPNTTLCSSALADGAILPDGARKIKTEWYPEWKVPTSITSPGVTITKIYQGQPDQFAGGVAANCTNVVTLPDGSYPPLICKEVVRATLADGSPDLTVEMAVRQYTYDVSGRLLTSKDTLNRTTTYSYYTSTNFTGVGSNAIGNTIGDLQSISEPGGFVTTFKEYDPTGRILKMTDPKGVVTDVTYTLRGFVKTVTTTAPGLAGRTTTYNYDNVGQVTGVTQPDGSSVTYTYDAAHRLIGITDARGNSIDYTLDNVGNRIAEDIKDPAGTLQRSVSRSFDALNRMQRISGVIP